MTKQSLLCNKKITELYLNKKNFFVIITFDFSNLIYYFLSVLQIKLTKTPYNSKDWKGYGQ